MAKSSIKSYVEAGSQFSEMSRQQAEALVKMLVKSAEIRRRDAEHMVQTMLSRGRETTEQISALVQAEVAKQLKALSHRFEEVEGRLESLAGTIKVGIVGAAGMSGPASEPLVEQHPAPEAGSTTDQPAHAKSAKLSTSKKAAKQSGTKKSSAKKSGAKKSGAKKSGAKKSGAKKTGAKKTGAKKQTGAASTAHAVGTSGVRKVSTSRPTTTAE